MAFESLLAYPEVIKTSVIESKDIWDLKKESLSDKKWEDDITSLSNTEIYKWEEEQDKSPDMTNYVDRSLEHDINSYETLKSDQILKKEQLENKTSDLSNKIQETKNNIENLELKSDILKTLEDTLNNIVVYLNSIGIKIEKFDFTNINELNTDIDNEKLNFTKLDNQSKEFQSKINTTEQNIDSLNDNINAIEQKKKYFDENLKSKYDSFDDSAKEKNLTPSDIDAINEAKKELIEKLNEANVDKLSQKQFIEEMDQYVISSIENLNEELNDFDPDFKEVFKSTSISAGVGAGVGAATGGPFGALVGATLNGTMGAVGELSSQYLKYKGASDTEALLVQTGVEVIGGAGLVKIGSKLGVHGGKLLIKNIDKLDDVAKVSSKLDKTDDVIKSANKLDNVDDSIKITSKLDKVDEGIDTLSGKIKDINPNIGEGKLNLLKGEIAERTQDSYYLNSGWKKIEGEVGRNGIDGLYYKYNKNGTVKDVLISESKYNTSKLGETLNGKQMSKEWITKKLDNLIEAYPDNKDYQSIKKLVDNDQYRARLWQLKENGDNLQINVSKILQKGHNDIGISKLNGSESLKINNFQKIDLLNPSDKYSQKITDMYNQNVNYVVNNSKYII